MRRTLIRNKKDSNKKDSYKKDSNKKDSHKEAFDTIFPKLLTWNSQIFDQDF
jgi:hypothetical protein